MEGILLGRLRVQRLQRFLEAEGLLLLGSRVAHTDLPLTALLDELADEFNQAVSEFPIPISHLLLFEEKLGLADELLGIPEVDLPIGLAEEVFAEEFRADVVESEGVLDEGGKALEVCLEIVVLPFDFVGISDVFEDRGVFDLLYFQLRFDFLALVLIEVGLLLMKVSINRHFLQIGAQPLHVGL